MRIVFPYGRGGVDLDVAADDLIPTWRAPDAADLTDPAAAVRDALENPYRFPALRRALTPDDHVTVVIDESLPRLGGLLTPVLEHLASAGISPSAVTLLSPPGTGTQDWLDDLPEEFEDVRVEVHDPNERKKLSYLATTSTGRRLYLNRSAVEAEQLVVLTRRDFDPLTGYAGGEMAIFPALADAEARAALHGSLSMQAPGEQPWPPQKEAAEVVWLLGAPFFVQVIEGGDGEVAHVVAGVQESSAEGQRLLNARWRVETGGAADVVVAGLGGDPDRHTFAALARALACAARVVKPEGRIVLLTEGTPELGQAAATLQRVADARLALKQAAQDSSPDREALFYWASAAQRATIYLLSCLPAETAEELLTVPLRHAGETQRLLGSGRSCLFLPDAHKALAVVRSAVPARPRG